ncbi:MAG: mannose-1-phosphate guanylyltransferase, partial [Muribaculaceae bacterium]|nr:mannose-1-phosphate guanylyltransferase [Muribaculaceae bacterium]
MFGVILAGGSGSRLWPLSRELYPKQLLNLYAEKSLLQSTFERLNKFIPAKNIISVTNTKHSSNVWMQLDENSIILSEPISKNTAPAIALSVKYIMENSDEDETVLVVPSDLLIENNENFAQSVLEAQKFVNDGCIVTFGVKPNYPETGFGYIQAVDNKVTNFTEKPDRETAEKYLQSENYYWNSGIFMFKTSTIIEEFEKYCPEISSI